MKSAAEGPAEQEVGAGVEQSDKCCLTFHELLSPKHPITTMQLKGIT